MMKSGGLASFAILLWFATAHVAAENWPGWRGPRGDGSSLEQGIAQQWNGPRGTNVAWRVRVPGQGHSSPVVWEDRLFLTSCLEDTQQRVLLCFDSRTGSLRWQQMVLTAPLEQKHHLNSFASGTPVTDGNLVYVTFLQPAGLPESVADRPERLVSPGDMVVVAYDQEGQEKWRAIAGPFSSIHGFCSSPVIYRDSLIVNGDHDGDSYLVALDRFTGAVLWKTPRQYRTRSYVTPLIRTIHDEDQLVLPGSHRITGYRPQDGSEIWVIDGPTEQFVASPVFNGRMWFVTAGFPDHHILAIRPGGRGNISKTHIAWRTTKGCAYVPSPLVLGRFFLVVSDSGIGSCFEAESGDRYWMQRLGPGFSASPVCSNGLVYFTADDGVTKVIRPGEELELVADNQLGESVSASPAISQGRLYLRGHQHLFCITDQATEGSR